MRPETILSPAVAVVYTCPFETNLQCKIQLPEKNLTAVELFLRPDCGRTNFLGGFSAAVNFSAAAAKFGGWGLCRKSEFLREVNFYRRPLLAKLLRGRVTHVRTVP